MPRPYTRTTLLPPVTDDGGLLVRFPCPYPWRRVVCDVPELYYDLIEIISPVWLIAEACSAGGNGPLGEMGYVPPGWYEIARRVGVDRADSPAYRELEGELRYAQLRGESARIRAVPIFPHRDN